MLWNLLTAGIFGTDYYIKKKINTSEKKDLKEKCLGGRLIVRNCHNHGMMLGILKNKDKEFLRDLASMVLGGAIWEYIRTSGEKGTRISKLGLSMILGGGYQKKYGYSPITREMLDDFAYNSQLKADKAIKDGAFKDEIVPVVIKGKKGDTVFDTDEGPRLSAPEVLAKLKPAFTKDGIVTAANSSAINDGAAALVIMSEEKAKELGVKPLATWVAGALAGVEPEVMGLGPIAATKKVMAKTGLTVADMDLVEANEAFAAQSIAVGEALGFDKDKLNVNGGAIALGHPVGASGARILVTLLYAMKHRGAHKGLATLCIGGGMGCATIVEMD